MESSLTAVEKELLSLGLRLKNKGLIDEARDALISGLKLDGLLYPKFFRLLNELFVESGFPSEVEPDSLPATGMLMPGFHVMLDALSPALGATWKVRNGVHTAVGDETLAIIAAKLLLRRPSVVAVDVGAGSGAFSLLPAIHPAMRVAAVEPLPLAYEALRRNVALNGLGDRVWPVHAVVGEHTADSTTVYTAVCPDRPGDTQWYLKARHTCNYTVPVTSLDQLFDEKVDFIRIHSVGNELNVLKGAAHLLARDWPDLLFVNSDMISQSFAKRDGSAFMYLTSMGYEHIGLDFYHSLFFHRSEPEIMVLSADLGGVVEIGNWNAVIALLAMPAEVPVQLYDEVGNVFPLSLRPENRLFVVLKNFTTYHFDVVAAIGENFLSEHVVVTTGFRREVLWPGEPWTFPNPSPPPVTAGLAPTRLSAQQKKEIEELGFTILKGVLTPEQADHARSLVMDLVAENKNVSQRVLNLELQPGLAELLNNELLLDAFQFILGRQFKLSSWTANIIYPGDPTVNLHLDHPLYHLHEPRPLEALVSNSIWCLDEFTADNGATRAIPTSHKWRWGRPGQKIDWPNAVPIIANKGDVIVQNGAIWHGATGNKTNRPRVALLGFMAAQNVLSQGEEAELREAGHKIWPSEYFP